MRYVLFVSILATFAGAAYAGSQKPAHSGSVAANNRACIPCTENVKVCGDSAVFAENCRQNGNPMVLRGKSCKAWYDVCK